jgi:hypothetical protein
MPTNARVKTFSTGQGSYTHPGLSAFIATQSSSGGATYNMSVAMIAPYVSGILPGWGTGQRPVQGTAVYGVIRAVYLTTVTTMSGTGVAGAGATATVQLYRSGASAKTAATLAFNTGVDATALTPKAITVSTTLTNIQVRYGDLIVFRWAQGATGLTLPEAMLQIDII